MCVCVVCVCACVDVCVCACVDVCVRMRVHVQISYSTVFLRRFLALSKVLPGQDFLQILDFPDAVGPKRLEYDFFFVTTCLCFFF